MDLLQYNNNDNERIQMLKMPKIHYIDVKSDEQHQQDITVLKSLEVSGTSLACLIMICSYWMLHIKNIMTKWPLS